MIYSVPRRETVTDYQKFEQESIISAQVSRCIGMFGNVGALPMSLMALMHAMEHQSIDAMGMALLAVTSLIIGRTGYKLYHDHTRNISDARRRIQELSRQKTK